MTEPRAGRSDAPRPMRAGWRPSSASGAPTRPSCCGECRPSWPRCRPRSERCPTPDWQARGMHPTRGAMPVSEIVDRFIVEHLEEHADQLDGLELVTIDEIRQAAERIRGVATRTPLLRWDDRTWLKPESLQPVGAFKMRGAYNAIRLPVRRGAVPGSGDLLIGQPRAGGGARGAAARRTGGDRDAGGRAAGQGRGRAPRRRRDRLHRTQLGRAAPGRAGAGRAARPGDDRAVRRSRASSPAREPPGWRSPRICRRSPASWYRSPAAGFRPASPPPSRPSHRRRA